MLKSAKERRSLIFLILALSITGFLLTMALMSRSDYLAPSETTKSHFHEYKDKAHVAKNFTAAAELVEKSPTNHSSSDTSNQVPKFSAFDSAASSNSSQISNNTATEANTTTANLNNSNIKSQMNDQLPFGLPGSKSIFDNRAKLPSRTDNTTQGTQASNTAESLIGSIMSPRTLLSTAIEEMGNGTTKSHSNETDRGSLATPRAATILLSNEVVPPKDYLYLYDSLVSNNVTGHLIARLPCSSDMKSELLIMTGYLPRLKPVSDIDAKPLGQMSKPGLLCAYGVQISQALLPQSSTDGNKIFDIAIFNPNKFPIRLPPGSSLIVNLFDPLPS